MQGIRVSVVVPVYRPGPRIDELIRSLDRQTMDAAQFEVLLCDDGSGPETAELLAGIARDRANVRVLTLEHTGWPGTPRNHGIDAARGEYVFFADQDDRLFEGALSHLCDYGDRHSSDVVIGKVVGIGRRIPRLLFRDDVPHAELGVDPLLDLLTPHKLFRTAFLREHGIRYPDGRVRLEDHLFVMQAYFRARTISILASEPCYAWIKNEGSASSARIDPVTYFPHLERVLDLVEANTEPGALRDRLLRHWYRGKILNRLTGRRLVHWPQEYRETFLDVVTPIAQQRFGEHVERGLAFPLRIRSALLRAGRRDDLVRFGEFEAGLGCRAELESAAWTRSGRLRLSVRAVVLPDGDDGLRFVKPGVAERGDPDAAAGRGRAATTWHPPAALASAIPDDVRDAARDVARDRVELYLRPSRDDPERRFLGRSARGRLRGAVLVDPLNVSGRGDPSRGGAVTVTVHRAGWTFDTTLRADPQVVAAVGRPPLLAGRGCALRVRADGTVELYREGGGARDSVARVGRAGIGAARRWMPAWMKRRVRAVLDYRRSR